jgi:hypothetical protein
VTIFSAQYSATTSRRRASARIAWRPSSVPRGPVPDARAAFGCHLGIGATRKVESRYETPVTSSTAAGLQTASTTPLTAGPAS